MRIQVRMHKQCSQFGIRWGNYGLIRLELFPFLFIRFKEVTKIGHLFTPRYRNTGPTGWNLPWVYRAWWWGFSFILQGEGRSPYDGRKS